MLTAAERQKLCRARKKQRDSQSNVTENVTYTTDKKECDIESNVTQRVTLTPAEKQRRYRERQKQKEPSQDQTAIQQQAQEIVRASGYAKLPKEVKHLVISELMLKWFPEMEIAFLVTLSQQAEHGKIYQYPDINQSL